MTDKQKETLADFKVLSFEEHGENVSAEVQNDLEVERIRVFPDGTWTWIDDEEAEDEELTLQRKAEIAAALLELCGHPGCFHFIQKNPAHEKPGDGIAPFVHVCDPDVCDPDSDHEAVPSGDLRTLASWKVERPEFFPQPPCRF